MKIEKERKVPIYRNKELLGKFIVKYLFNFFLYGYLFLCGTIIFGLLFFKLFSITYGVIKYLQFLWLIPSGYCFIRFIAVLLTTNYKWRLYRIAHYRLKTREYSEDYFKYEIYEPCTRLIVKNIMYEYGLKNEYIILKNKYLKVDQRIEDQKARILSNVIRRNKEKQLQEVFNG